MKHKHTHFSGFRPFMMMIAFLLVVSACNVFSPAAYQNEAQTRTTENGQEKTTDNRTLTDTTGDVEADDADVEFEMAEDGAAAMEPPMVAQSAPVGAAVMSTSVAPVEVRVDGTATDPDAAVTQQPQDMFFEEYGVNPMLDTADDHLSTFAMDVDTASYTLARSYLRDYGQLPPAEAIRPEEFINYFASDYEGPEGDDAFAIHLTAAPAPFGYENHYLMEVGLQGRYILPEDRDPALLIFVIDISGSMDMENRLGLVKQSLAILVDELREDDRVAIVVYADNTRVILEPTPASEKAAIMGSINELRPAGSTYAEAGLNLGYQVALDNMRDGENTRVILLSDGVANVGSTGPDAILETIKEGVDAGVTLSTIGFGMGNFNDVLMEQLANDGNGNYYYVDNLREARRVFVHNLASTLQVIAYDAKVQVDFNPEVTDRYRLIGYENRAIADEDFRNDTVDAGEVGAGHSVTAMYEFALEDDDPEGVVATVYIRYKDAETGEIVEVSQDITTSDLLASIDDASPTFKLHAGVAEFSELLRESYWAEGGTYGSILSLIEPVAETMPDDEQVSEFVELIQLAISYGDQ